MSPSRPSGKRRTPGRAETAAKIILASVSPRRRELLARIVPDFRVVPSNVNEDQFRGPDPAEFALRAAVAKAVAVGHRYASSLIIAADTVVVLGDETFGKPGSRAEARGMLLKLAGRKHRVITAVVLYRHADGRTLSGLETSRVTIKNLSQAAIEEYLDSAEYADKAGAYAIQESGQDLVARLEGAYDNVVGLPLALLRDLMGRVYAG
jgi:septum formation protein